MTFNNYKLIPAQAQPRVRWKNGAGWTTEIAVHPATGEFDWRLSVAEVDADCEFSSFPGIDRTILALSGPGFDLFIDHHDPVHLRPGAPPHAFSGDLPARCTVAGPSRDFNVMTRRNTCTHTLTELHLDGALSLPRTNATTALYLAHGHAAVPDTPLAPGDCLLLAPVPGDSLTLTGAATLLQVDITFRSSTAARGTTN